MQPDIPLSILSNIAELTLEIFKAVPASEQAAQMTPMELEICRIWQQALGYTDLDKDDDLFKIGGDSVVAIQIISLINKEFGIQISIQALFSSEHFTISWLAELVEQYYLGAIDESEYSQLLAQIEDLSEEEVQQLLHGAH